MKPLPLSNWDSSLKHVVDDMRGRPLNIHSLLANHPRLLNAWWNLRNYSVNGGDLEQRDCELVILRVAVRTRTWYEWASHVDRALACGLTMEEVERVREGPVAPEWRESDAVLLQTIDELIDERAVSQATREKFAEFFSENQLLDVIVIHGMYIAIACMINTLGLPLDEHIQERLPANLNSEEDWAKPAQNR